MTSGNSAFVRVKNWPHYFKTVLLELLLTKKQGKNKKKLKCDKNQYIH